MKAFYTYKSYNANFNSIIDTINLIDILNILKVPNAQNLTIKNAWINISGYQSLLPSLEVSTTTKQNQFKLTKKISKNLNFPETLCKNNSRFILGSFCIYLRWDNTYLAFCSVGNLTANLPSVQFIVNKENNTIQIELSDKGKKWQENELQAQIEIFYANSYFELKNKLEKIFGTSDISSKNYSNRFALLDQKKENILGWSCFSNSKKSLSKEKVLLDLEYIKKFDLNNLNFSKYLSVFLIERDWVQTVGDWNETENFSSDLKSICELISAQGYLPGIWLAPFVVSSNSLIAKKHPEWILKNVESNTFIEIENFTKCNAGKPLWVLDLSNPQVIEYLTNVMDKIINNWGFQIIKLDYLFAGMLYGKFQNKNAAYEWYNQALNAITKIKINNKGQKIIYIGAACPYEATFKIINLIQSSSVYPLSSTLNRSWWNEIIYSAVSDNIFFNNNNLKKSLKFYNTIINFGFNNHIFFSNISKKLKFKKNLIKSEFFESYINKIQNKQIGVEALEYNIYKFYEKNNDFEGIIDLEKKHKVLFTTKID